MIRVIGSTSGASAKAYFSSGLARADYYTDEIIGKWHGKAAEKFGLSGEVKEEEFSKLCENTHPISGEKLNPRENSKRTVGWDFNFHAPKSVSLVHALTGDQRIQDAFRQSVAETMADIEAQTQTRVRKNGVYEDRETANLAWAEFVHLTARPVAGIPDPHLHVHAFVFNSTYDDVEGRWKAAKMKEARRDMPLHQATFHSRLAKRIEGFGYSVKRTRTGWEIAGISRSAIDKSSRRTALIEREAAERGIVDDAEKDKLGAMTREGKRKGLTQTELKQAWEARLNSDELKEIQHAKNGVPLSERPNARQAFDHALEKLFARDSVVRKNRVLAEALRFGVGYVTPEQIQAEYKTRKLWEKNYHGEILCTHNEVLAEEIALVAYVREGKGKHSALVTGKHHFERDFLSDEQQAAVNHIIKSNDRVIALRGGAGTGKTTAMQEVVTAIEATGINVYALAPSADASRGTLREAGFDNADTVAQFINNPQLHEQAQGHVVWVDEAGLLGTRELSTLIDKAGPDNRIILTGDTKQHGPVARGDAFRVLQEFAGLRPAEITEIRRQKPETYKAAVSDLSQGDLQNAFLKLDTMGAIKEIEDDAERYHRLASDYTRLSTAKTSPLVVSPTRRESHLVTNAIREKLTETGTLKNERQFIKFRNLHFETAERREAENYEPGMMIQYHQNATGVKRGAKFFVNGVSESGDFCLRNEQGDLQTLPFGDAQKFQVFATEPIKLAAGDKIRITRNGFSRDGKRHSNGNTRTIKSFTKEGHLKLTTGAIIDKAEGHFEYGYCQTSHSSQSKSVKNVLIAQSSESFAAASREQFYVSVSRGKENVRIYTDDRIALQEMVGNSSAKQSALELAKDRGREWNAMIEKELDRSAWKTAVSEKGLKATAQQFAEKLQRRKTRPSPLKETTPRKWAEYVSQRRGYGEFTSKTAPVLNIKRATPTQTKPNSSTIKTKQKKPSRLRRIASLRMKRLSRSLKRGSLWMSSTNLLRNTHRRRHDIRSFQQKPNAAKNPTAKASLKPVKRVIVRRPVTRR